MGGWTEDKEIRFVNPYNFVPFEPKSRYVPEDETKLKTGYVECNLTVLTPLFIPNTSSDCALHDREENETSKKTCSYDFFSYEDLQDGRSAGPSAPVIPGSELHGMVRSVHEAAFQGCVSSVDLKRVLERRSPDAKKAGILRKVAGNWYIKPCRRLMLKVRAFQQEEPGIGCVTESLKYQSWEEGQTVYVRTANGKPYVICEIRDDFQKGWKKGYLHKGEPFETKKSESVFVEKNEKEILVDIKDIEFLKKAMAEYHKLNPDCYPAYVNESWDLDKTSESEKILVYYYSDEKTPARYLSPACIGKELFQQDVKRLLTNSGVEPCTRRKALCTTCALFGMVSKEEEKDGYEAVGSKVRFEDAVLVNASESKEEIKSYYLKPILLPELGEPKPGAVEFYMEPPNGRQSAPEGSYGYWTYDYMKGFNTPRDRAFFSKEEVHLRGRKFYWHSDVRKEYMKANDNNRIPTEMQQIIRPLKRTIENRALKFGFKIFFERVRLRDIQQLCWALDFQDETCAHKLGRGKPLGFGSVKIEIEDVKVREIDLDTGCWAIKPLEKEKWRGALPLTEKMSVLKKIMQWEERFRTDAKDDIHRAEVCYPKGQAKVKGEEKDKDKDKANATASHQWFRGNRSIAKDAAGTRPLFSKVLPKIEEELDKDRDTDKDKWLYELTEK